MRIDFEEKIVQNPAIGAIVVWHFISEFQKRRTDSHPNLAILFLVLPIIFHRASVEKLKGMNFSSGLSKALTEFPLLSANLTRRVASFAPLTLTSINLACASDIITRLPDGSPAEFKAKGTLPSSLNPKGHARDMAKAARRLGAFFADSTPAQIRAQLRIGL